MNDKAIRTILLGTDWWTDCDDAVAIRLLTRAHKEGRIHLAGIGINACMDSSVRSLDAFVRSHGVDDVRIGIDLEATDFGGNPPYQKNLALQPSVYRSNIDAEKAVHLYRSILAESTEPIEIIEIGFLQAIADVLKSGPDDISEKSGYDLVREKVSKIWVMAGKWDQPNGLENNFARNDRARKAAAYFCENCPVPITFLGFEVGVDVITGNTLKEDDILYRVLCDHGSRNGRSSWDPMTVYLALIGDEEKAGFDFVCGKASVDPESGANNFAVVPDGMHRYVVKKNPNEFYADAINTWIE